MAGSGKSVDPILVGIVALGVVGVGVIYFLASNQKIPPLPEPERPNLVTPQAAQMQGNPAMWGLGEQQPGMAGGMPGGMPTGPAMGPMGPGPAAPGPGPGGTSL